MSAFIFLDDNATHEIFNSIEKQTVAYNIQARVDFRSRPRVCMGVWEAMEQLNTLVDDSDPDVSSSNLPKIQQHRQK